VSVQFIDRPPRIQPELPQGKVKIPVPPEREEGPASPVAHALLPLVTIIGYVVVSAAGQGRNLLLIIPMALSVVGSVAFSFISYHREKGAGEQKIRAYRQRLADLRREMVAAHDMQRIFYLYNYPDPDTILKIASGEEDSRSGTRLWERRPTDQDFGSIRLGLGTRPSTVIYEVDEAVNNSQDELALEAMRLAEVSRFVSDVPITIPLRPDPTQRDKQPKSEEGEEEAGEKKEVLPRHAIGIVGDNRATVSDFVRALAVHFTAFHSPIDTRLYVIGAPESRRRWEWAMWLPHTNTRSERYVGDQMCFDNSGVTAFWDALRDELDKRRLRLQDEEQAGDVTLPFLLVIVDKLDVDEQSPLWATETEAAASIIMQRGQELGAAIIFMVPEASKVPSECQAVIEVEPVGSEVAFRYAEVGLNSQRYIGAADTLDAVRAEKQFAYLIKDYAVRRSFGEDIATYIDLLELNNVSRMEELPILENWRRSRAPEHADWIRVPLGLGSGNKTRVLYMSQDHDGVHGMIAGTTGSGKSELLLTLIAGIALLYDPTIVNFALVDYKGGAAFEPFRELPHCVDIVTNLMGNAVDRMFIAIKAELDRRSKLLSDYNVKHIVEYRRKGYHLQNPFPHLFIIVDEFAEMVQENAEFKARFDSITRLGRAIGVSLILATQRPTGAVTDQMRANMKFKICLRVETPDDSRELLRRSDAAFLPSNLPGRAYIMIGNENPELMQVARAGGPYVVEEEATLEDVIWLDEVQQIVETAMEQGVVTLSGASDGGDGNPDGGATASDAGSPTTFTVQEIADAINGRPETMVDWVVGMTALLARRTGVPRQAKPWPDPLPERLPLNLPIDATYINTERATAERTLVLAPPVAGWLEGAGEWQPTNWREKPLQVDIGIVDNPYDSEQRLLTVDLTRGPLVLFGAPGWGKTTFLRTLMIALAARHSPAELQIYALDFGKGGLNVLKALPHLGASIDSTEDQRVERLLRMLGNMLENRRSRITQYGSLAAYNAENPDDVIPAVLVVIDNFGEFKENYEDKVPTLTSLVRDGRAFGIYFVITASQTSDVPTKLYNLFTERMSLKLPDPTEYSNIVGRGAPAFNDVAGRGVVNINRTPLEFQCAIPILRRADDESAFMDEGELYEDIAQAMSVAWTGVLPEPVEILPEVIFLRDMLTAHEAASDVIEPIIGLNDLDRKPTRINLTKLGPHFLIGGPPLSGKTVALRTWILSLAHSYSPHQVGLVLVDPKKALYAYGGEHSLADLPHVLQVVSEPRDVEELIGRLRAEFDDELAARLRTQSDAFRPEGQGRPAIVVIMDNYDDFSSMAGRNAASELGELARQYGSSGLHFVIGGSLAALRTRDELLKQAESPRYSLILQDAEAVRNMGGKVPYALMKAEYPPGRGFVVKSVRTALTQVAIPYDEYGGRVEEELDEWVEAIQAQHRRKKAAWRYQGPLEPLRGQEAAPAPVPTIGATVARVEVPKMEAHVQEEFIRQLKEMGIDPSEVLGTSGQADTTGD